jgi:D-amino peptidase
MRIMLMTDLEGVAGVKNAPQWCNTDSQFYGVACRLLTLEVNAAVEGFFSGGAQYVMVADGHGAGAIDIERLDARVEYARGWPAERPWPFGLDASFNGIAWVGQHAKASSEYAHLCHTQSFRYIDLSVNGVSIGEFGQFALCGSELGVPAFFGAGDLAFTHEAEALVPDIVTCAVKRGVTPGTGEDCTDTEYRDRNAGAVHIPPERARAMIRKAAEAAAWKLKKSPPPLIPLKPPFERVAILRPEKRGEPKVIARETHPASVIEVMGLPMDFKPVT